MSSIVETSVGRRVLSWLELAIGGLLLAAGAYYVGLGVLTGHRDPHHGGIYPIIFGVLIAGTGACFAVAGVALRGRQAWGWYLQLLPAAVVGWILWDVLSH
jgi:hypothetical protein